VQGTSLNNYIIDLRRPPAGKFQLENLYVMLSRATTWNDFAIPCDFEDSIFRRSDSNEPLERYSEYLQRRNLETQQKFRDEREYIANLRT
jgi:hypothetical protein